MHGGFSKMKKNHILKILTGSLCLTLGFATISGCAGGKIMKDSSGRIGIQSDYFVLDNSKIIIKIDKRTGYMSSIENLTSKVNFKDAEKGSWPFEIEFGENNQKSTISKETKNKINSYKAWDEGDTSYLDLTYNDLKLDWNGSSTGISAVSHFAISKNNEYIKMSTSFDLTNAKGSISSIKYCESGDLKSGGENERITAPTWGGGTYWADPVNNTDFKNGVTLGYPGQDNKTLECGWIDIHNSDSGIGIALINKKKMATEFKISSGVGMNISCVLFNPINITGQNIPLKKGETFISDEIIIAPHTGDWHTMADIYRAEYEKAFVTKDGKPDYLTWNDISSKVKNTDYMIRYFAGMDGEFVTSFGDMYDQTVSQINAMNADPKNCMVWIAGQNAKGYAFNVPIMVPSYPKAGGDAGLKELDDKLHAIGATAFHYEHPFAVDPDDIGYFANTDPLQHTEAWNMCTHHAVCIDNKNMNDLWVNKIIPDIKSLNADGLQFDQAPLQQTACNLKEHNHKLDAVSVLSSHSAGIEFLEKQVRANLSEDAYIVSEGASDILCRYVDVRQACWHVEPLWNGDYEFCASQYTFPQYVVQSTSIYHSKESGTQNAMLFGAITGGIECLSDGASGEIRNEFIRFRKEIRTAKAPGFPYGFRDNLGVTTNNVKLIAKAFTDGISVTLTYLSKSKIENGIINVDLDKLGFVGKGIKEIKLDSLKTNTCGFQIINP